jgi:WD40 repeat protein
MVWRLASRQLQLKLPQEQWVNCVAFSVDGKSLAVACGRYKPESWKDPVPRELPGEVKVYDPVTGRLKASLRHEHGSYAVAFSPDGRWLVSGGGRYGAGPKDPGAEVFVWDARTWQRVDSLKGLSARVLTLAFSPDGKALAVGDGGGTVRLYAPPAQAPHKTLSVQRGHVSSLAFSPDGALLVRTDAVGDVALWDVAGGGRLHPPYQGNHDEANVGGGAGGVLFHPDGRALGISNEGGEDPRARFVLWGLTSGVKEDTWGCHGHVTSQAISPRGNLLATGLSRAGTRNDETIHGVVLWQLPPR